MKLPKLPQLGVSAFLLLTTVCNYVSAQNPSGFITDWRDDAKGAYTIIHDDYGDSGVDGIWQYADTICYNRGVKFTIGAIASSCESSRNINGYSTPYEYAKEVMIEKHGHEIMSHSHTHSCALGNAGWSPCEMAVGWGEDTTVSAFNYQLVTAHNSILNGTGIDAKYYIFPYDRHTDAANMKLKKMGYLGSRTGWSSYKPGDSPYHRNGYENSDEVDFFPDSNGFFRTAVQVFDDNNSAMNHSAQVAELNGEVDNAIANNQWANRELHNVTYSGWGWGRVRVTSYREHIDYVKSKMESGELFVGTVSEIMTYQMQKLKFSPSFNYDETEEVIDVSWDVINPQYDVDMVEYMSDLYYKSPITLMVKLDLTGAWKVAQNNIEISDVKQTGDTLYINVYPHQGDLVIYNENSNVNLAPKVEKSINDYMYLLTDFEQFKINLKDVFEDETADEQLKFTYSGNTGIVLNVNKYNRLEVSSQLGWFGTDTIIVSCEDEFGLITTEEFIINVLDIFNGNSPFFNDPLEIPGRIQVEDYDEGGEGIAFHEQNSSKEPDAALNPYRPNDDPDIISIPSGGYCLSYSIGSEWLEYTVDVTKGGWYNVVYRAAQMSDGWGAQVGRYGLYIDNQVWIPTSSMSFTSGEFDFTNVNRTGVIYLTKGIHLMKLEVDWGGTNLDYIDVVESPVSAEEILFNQRFEVYPNPANSIINLKGDFELVKIYNQVGELVLSTSENKLDISMLSEGIYYVRFDENERMIKLVKTK